MPPIVACFNQVGGVGKTTLTQNIGYQLTLLNQRVLLIDLDPQSSLTYFMGLAAHELQARDCSTCMIEAATDDKGLPYRSTQMSKNLWLTPANLELAQTQYLIHVESMREQCLLDALRPILSNFDIVLIDSPPSLDVLAINALHAASHVLVPVHLEFKAYVGTDLLLRTIGRIRKRGNRQLEIAGFVANAYNKRFSMHQQVLEQLKADLAGHPEITGKLLGEIGTAIAFAEASAAGLPLALYDPRHERVRELEQVADRLLAEVSR